MRSATTAVPATGTDEELKDWFIANFNRCAVCLINDADYLAVGKEQSLRVCSKCAGFDAVALEAARRGAPVHYCTPSGKQFTFYVLDVDGWPLSRFETGEETNRFYKFNETTQKVEATEWTEEMHIEIELPPVAT
jgi:hypothetical protein